MKFEYEVNNFHFKNAFENVACKITAILSLGLTPSAPTAAHECKSLCISTASLATGAQPLV